ncbi:hypothetical protein ATANTOWER_008370 [Ataeniobius toweri]|uniref:Uncharacterized protein n=1 Tax=Ataeniobius toweri TaxID=208326 RepID=A0ABU7AXD6_9TELE|nr:hypothetical protein [Ataeniobius toweri]
MTPRSDTDGCCFLLPGCRERISTVFYFQLIVNHTLKIDLFMASLTCICCAEVEPTTTGSWSKAEDISEEQILKVSCMLNLTSRCASWGQQNCNMSGCKELKQAENHVPLHELNRLVMVATLSSSCRQSISDVA